MRVLITGGTGFIGSHTAVALLRAGHSVKLLIRDADKMKKVYQPHGVTISDYVLGDVTDAECVRNALQDCDAVVHSAAMVATSKSMADIVHRTNVDGTKNVIGQAAELGIKHIFHVSSITALYSETEKFVNEKSKPGKASNAYGNSKVECEHFVRSLQARGAPIVVTYPTGVIGPHDPNMTEPLQGLATFLKFFAPETTTGIQYIDVRDIADVHVKLLDREPGPDRFMLGGVYHSWLGLYDLLEELTGRKLLRTYIPPKMLQGIGSTLDYVVRYTGLELPMNITREATTYATKWCHADSQKIHNEMGFSFRDGRQTLIDTILWLEQAGHIKAKHLGKLIDEHTAPLTEAAEIDLVGNA